MYKLRVNDRFVKILLFYGTCFYQRPKFIAIVTYLKCINSKAVGVMGNHNGRSTTII